MRIAYIELCIYLISKSVTYKPGRYKSWRKRSGSPELARNTYIHLVVSLRVKYYTHLVVGLRAKYYMHLVVVVGLRGKIYIRAKGILYDML